MNMNLVTFNTCKLFTPPQHEHTSLFLFMTVTSGLGRLDQFLNRLVAECRQVRRRLFSEGTDLSRRDECEHILDTGDRL